MSGMKSFAKPISLVLVFAFLSAINPGYGLASMIGTEEAIELSRGQEARLTLQQILSREDVRGKLVAWGLDPFEAKARVSALTDAEAIQMAHQIESLPAGGSGVGVIVGAALVVFLVLLFTDIAGLTNVFPFTNKNAI